MAKTFGSGDSATQKKVNNSAFTTDITISGTTPSLTIGDAGEEDSKIVFDGAAQDYYVGIDDTDDDLKIGLGSAVGTTPAITIDENQAVVLPAASVTIGDGTAEDTKLVFDGNAKDFYMGLDDSADNLVFGKGSTLGTTQYAAFTDANAEGLMYKPHTILDAGTGGTTLTALQSGTTIVLSDTSGFVTLPDGATTNYGMQFVIINATASNNTGAIRRSGTDTFYDSDTTGGEVANQAVAGYKAKTVIYFATNKWVVIG